jgi:hypothetical protein
LKIELLLCICFVNVLSWPQTETRGTVIVVFGLERGPVAVAADSQEYRLNGDTDNRVCKIKVLGNKLIIGASGYAGNGRSFSVFANANEVFASLPPSVVSGQMLLSKFVLAWRESLVAHINGELEAGTLSAASFADSHITIGVVVGLDEKGLITSWLIRVETRKEGNRTFAFAPPIEMSNHLPLFNALGKFEIPTETYYETTARGERWNRELWQGSSDLPLKDKSTYLARHLIDLTIKNLPSEKIGNYQIKTVGGPIDSVTIDHAGRIQWGRHKENCQ